MIPTIAPHTLLKKFRITAKEWLVLQEYALSDDKSCLLAEQLAMSPITFYKHMESVRHKLGVKTNLAAVIKAYRLGVINIGGKIEL